MAIRPNYYKDEAGHDLFWKMEHGMYDLAWSIGFCHINAEKYERRKGRKTAIIGIIGYGIVIACIGIVIYLIWFHTTWVIDILNGY